MSIPKPEQSVANRLARFSRSHHARDLWPDISESQFRSAERELARVAGDVLGGATSGVSLACPSGTTPRSLSVAAAIAGVGALIGYWCETGVVSAERDVHGLLADQLEQGRKRAERMRGYLDRLLIALADQGIEPIILKGTHTRYAYFPDPGTRITSDIDLLFRQDDWNGAHDVLRSLGFFEQRDSGDPEQRYWTLPDAREIRALDFVHAENAWSVDTHRSLERTPFTGLSTSLGTPDFATAPVWNEFSRPVRVLPQPLLLAYLAVHASSHFYTISQIRLIELVLVAQHDYQGRPDRWVALDRLLASTRTGRFAFPALALAERLVPGTIDSQVLAHAGDSAPRRLRRLVRDTSPASAQRLHPLPGVRERFVWIASPREAFAALSWLAWPRQDGTWVSPHYAVRRQFRRITRSLSRFIRGRLPTKPAG
ncbi:MAG TPA: nucleotidyltransferase family protein [Gemmatimonadales bacterium]|nr:nucleotidyltransferase family protein [Gemmatimonadales bacterium]